MAPQIAHKHHSEGMGSLLLAAGAHMLSRYTLRLPFVGNRSTEITLRIPDLLLVTHYQPCVSIWGPAGHSRRGSVTPRASA